MVASYEIAVKKPETHVQLIRRSPSLEGEVKVSLGEGTMHNRRTQEEAHLWITDQESRQLSGRVRLP
jgi:hypothetical protein